MANEGELLIYPCAYRKEKGAREKWQAEGTECPASEQSSLLLFGMLKMGQVPIDQMDIMEDSWVIDILPVPS